MSPGSMKHPAGKVSRTGNERILITERGAQFGYHNLVADMTAIPVMKEIGYPVRVRRRAPDPPLRNSEHRSRGRSLARADPGAAALGDRGRRERRLPRDAPESEARRCATRPASSRSTSSKT